VSTSSVAPTNPSLYNWVRFIGKSGTGSGDMLATDYATKYPNTVDKAAALYDGTDEILANQLMKKSQYDADDDGVVDNANHAVNADNATNATNAVNATNATNATTAADATNASNLKKSDGTTVDADTITTKLSKVGEQILGTVSGNTATFTDAKIGGSDVYLTDIYCSDSARYIKSQSVSGNTLTVTFDDSVAGTTCVLQLFKKGV
ncbi:MAG: hypothetical protein PUK76_07245, partial [Treponema sp.]|nr:hypothetical protein [Treponema sp.]